MLVDSMDGVRIEFEDLLNQLNDFLIVVVEIKLFLLNYVSDILLTLFRERDLESASFLTLHEPFRKLHFFLF